MGIFVIMFGVFYGWFALLVHFPAPTVIATSAFITILAGSDNWFLGLCVGLVFSFGIRNVALPASYWPMIVGGLVGSCSGIVIELVGDEIAERKWRRGRQTAC